MLGNDIFKKNIIIFGASKAGQDIYKYLSQMGSDIKYFVDNDKGKWGKTLNNKVIYNPEVLREIDKDTDYIIIGSMYIDEISKQLNEMGLNDLYVDMFYLIDFLTRDNLKDSFCNLKNVNTKKKVDEWEYLLILPRGFVLGGAEIWSLKTYKLLSERKRSVALVSLSEDGKQNLIFPKDQYTIIKLLSKQNNFMERIKYLINSLSQYLPFVLITTNTYEIFLASVFLKKLFNHKFKLISILHSDTEICYMQNARYEGIIDKFICVSDEIKYKLIDRINHREKDICTLITPIKINNYTRVYLNQNSPLKLGYAGRLVKADKRTDYLIDLIEILENKNLNYEFEIAGEGEYSSVIKEFIINKGISNKVKCLGSIPNDQIDEFWRKQDILINVSDVEGASIAMFEGMGNGAVPIITNVAGVRRFVKHGENGFIVEAGDIHRMAQYIQYLEENRDLLEILGKRSIQTVLHLCNPEHFIEKLIQICEYS